MTMTDEEFDELFDRALDGDEEAIAALELEDGVEPREDFGWFGEAGLWD